MKNLDKYKKIIIALSSFVVVLYALFLLVLPNMVNVNAFKKDIQKIVFDTAKLDFDFDDIKIVTTPSLKAGVNAKGIKLSYPDGKQIASLKECEAKISLLPLLLLKLQVSDVLVDTPVLSVVMQKDGQPDVVEYLTKNVKLTTDNSEATTQELPIKISEKLPNVVVKNYLFTLTDSKTQNSLAVKGDKFVLDKLVLNKNFRIASNGEFLINNNPNIIYDFKVESFWPVISNTTESLQPQEMPQIDIIKELVKFNPKAKLTSDIVIKQKSGSLILDGYLNADGLSLKLDGRQLPDSFFHLLAKGSKTDVDTDVFINKNEKIDIKAIFSHGRNFKADLKVKTEQLSFVGIKEFFTALLNSLYIKNDLVLFNTKGVINADFNLKTDLKKFESDGYLKVQEGVISHKTIPVVIKNIVADIDFANSSLNIKNTGADINGARIKVEGQIDSKSNANIVVESDDINIAPLFKAFAPADVKAISALNSGIFKIKVLAKGRLDKIQPSVDAMLKGFVLKTKTPLPSVALSIANVGVNITPKSVKIIPFDLFVNSSKIHIDGGISDYLSNMKIGINISGNLVAGDIQKLLPYEFRQFVGAKGLIPINGLISGNADKIDLNIQAYTNAGAYFAPINIKKMIEKPGLVNVSVSLAGDKLGLNDIGLYLQSKESVSKDFALNKKGAVKIMGVNGAISGLSTSHPMLKADFTIPEQLILSNNALPNMTLKARGDLNISGDINRVDSLLYKGFFTVNDVNIPELLTKVQNADIEFNGNTITAKVQNLGLNGTNLNIDAIASTRFTNVLLVKSMNVTSLNFDVDKVFAMLDKMNAFVAKACPVAQPVSSNSDALMFPIKISNGKLDIKKFVMKQIGGNLEATDITGDFVLVNDVFKLDNLKATVFKGNVLGNVVYNLKTTAVAAKIKGQKIDANPAVTVFVALKDQLFGAIDFNADVTLKGATYEEQMKTLNGKVNFALKDGQMGSLGSFETFIKADNLLSQSFVSSKVGSIISTVAPYKTGKFSYLNGVVNIHNGVASLDSVKMSGPHMALLLAGNVNVLTMASNLQILGYLSSDIMGALGPIGDLSLDKFVSYIPKFGSKITAAFNSYNQAMKQADLDKIPKLTPSKDNAKAFKVILNGNLNNPPAAIKKFQWLNTPEKIAKEQSVLQDAVTTKTPVSKEEIKEQIKTDVTKGITNAIQNNAKVQQIQKNSTVKSLTDIYKFYKNSSGSVQNTPAQ